MLRPGRDTRAPGGRWERIGKEAALGLAPNWECAVRNDPDAG